MAKVQEHILNAFYERLSESDSVSRETIKAMRALLESGEKLKADDFVAILTKTTQREAV